MPTGSAPATDAVGAADTDADGEPDAVVVADAARDAVGAREWVPLALVERDTDGEPVAVALSDGDGDGDAVAAAVTLKLPEND